LKVAAAWILDANVVSEMMRPRPDRRVIRFLNTIPLPGVALASITVWEILNGIGCLEPARRRTELRERFGAVLQGFEDRVLAWTVEDARACAALLETRRRLGRPLDEQLPDAFLAAAAVSRNLTIVTRNTPDFEDTGARTVNPWEESA